MSSSSLITPEDFYASRIRKFIYVEKDKVVVREEVYVSGEYTIAVNYWAESPDRHHSLYCYIPSRAVPLDDVHDCKVTHSSGRTVVATGSSRPFTMNVRSAGIQTVISACIEAINRFERSLARGW